MGASQEKRKRRELISAGTDRKQIKEQDELRKKKRARRNTSIIAAVVVVFLVAIIIINSSFFYTRVSAVSVGDWKFTAAEFNYLYFSDLYNTYSSLYSTFGDSANSFLNKSMPLDKQISLYDSTKTWDEYFRERTLLRLERVAVLGDAAREAGYTLSDEDYDKIDAAIKELRDSYKLYGFSSLKAFLTANYGKGITEETVRRILEWEYLAGKYAEVLMDSMNYTDDEISSYYAEHKDEFDLLTFRGYYVSGAADAKNGIDSETAMAAAKETAEKIAAAKSEEEFNALVYENAPEESKDNYQDGKGTLYWYKNPNELAPSTSEWLLDSSRQEGDTTVIESSSGYYVFYFISRSDNTFNVRNVRHILALIEDAKDEGKVTEAEEKAKMLYRLWQNGEATEDSFAEIAIANSEDKASAPDGGLYENIYLGQMVKEFEDWCFDESRKPGDSGIIRTDYGFHIMYYIGEGDRYCDVLATEGLQAEDYKEWYDGKAANYETKTHFAMIFAE